MIANTLDFNRGHRQCLFCRPDHVRPGHRLRGKTSFPAFLALRGFEPRPFCRSLGHDPGRSGWYPVVLYGMARSFNLIASGEEVASQLGVEVERAKWLSLILVSSDVRGYRGLQRDYRICGLDSCLTLVRMAFGPDHRLLLPASGLFGASFLIGADLLARTLISPSELAGGGDHGLSGGPLFSLSVVFKETSMVPLIRVDRVGYRYNHQWVIKGISFDVEQGELVGLIGPNGSGKTTLLKCLARLLIPQEGRVLWEDQPLCPFLPKSDRPKYGPGFPGILPDLFSNGPGIGPYGSLPLSSTIPTGRP